MLTNVLKQYCHTLQHKGLYRRRQIYDDGLHFSHNDYLSLASHPLVKKAYEKGFKQYPAGSGGSMVVCGYHPIHKLLEQAFSSALKVDDCLVFSSGYAANLSIIHLLGQVGAEVLVDKAAHASIYDGLKFSGVLYLRYHHNDLVNLKDKIKQLHRSKVIMTEGIFSMSGQVAPLKEIAQLGQDLLVDEAHAFGVVGEQGLGAVVKQQLTQAEVPLRVIPFGKAFAATGAIVAGQSAWIEALLQFSRPYIYSTAISPAMSYGILKTLDVIRQADDRREKLQYLITYFSRAIEQSPLKWRKSITPIQQLQLGCPQLALAYAKKLQEQAIICLPMRPPTVNQRDTGLRIILNYHHETHHIDKLFICLHATHKEIG